MREEKDDMRRPMTSVAAAASTVCIGLAAGSPVTTGTTPESEIGVQVPDSNDRVEDYWTRDRMRAAKPTPKPLIHRDGSPVAPDEGMKDAE